LPHLKIPIFLICGCGCCGSIFFPLFKIGQLVFKINVSKDF
jgi:hypothetical protein